MTIASTMPQPDQVCGIFIWYQGFKPKCVIAYGAMCARFGSNFAFFIGPDLFRCQPG
jgi:hypothetical protein